MLNLVVLIGRLATEPELKYTPSGVPVATFRIAVNRPYSSQQGGEKEADFIDIVAWRQSAEFAANYLGKGRLVSVQGRLQVRSWVQQDGTRRWKTEVVANDLRGLDRPREGGEHPTAAGVSESSTGFQAGVADDEEFDPFSEE
jgi:single-strand DNA-binding protein